MSSFDRGRVSGGFSGQNQSPVLIPLVVCLITAAATVGTALLSHRLDADGRACTDFGTRLDRIDDLTDSEVKAHRLNALVAGNPLDNCESYKLAVRERDEVAAGVREGRSKGESPRDPMVLMPPRVVPVVPPGETQETPSPLILAQPSEGPATTPPQTDRLASVEPSPTSPLPEANLPALTVTPQEPVGPFEGSVGDKLTLKRSIEYELKPLQFFTTTYTVSKGTVMVTVDGQPYLTCKPGNTFHLFWKKSPDFSVVTYNKAAALIVTGQESGKNLGVSDCLDPLG